MHEPKTHFEQIPVEIVKKIARELPADDVIGDKAGSLQRQDEGASPVERWREVAQKVQQEQDPQKMIAMVQEVIATFDKDALHKRLPRTGNPLNPSGDSGEDQS